MRAIITMGSFPWVFTIFTIMPDFVINVFELFPPMNISLLVEVEQVYFLNDERQIQL